VSLAELGNLGEFISSVAVVISLIYVAIQIRQNSRETRLASVQRVLESSRDTILQLSGREVQQLFANAAQGMESLDEIDQQRLKLLRTAQLRNIEIAFLMNAEGVLDDETFEVFESRARAILSVTPEVLGFGRFTRRFQLWLEKIRLDEHGT
jgi:hypothetical protein